jgi:phosphomannomutase
VIRRDVERYATSGEINFTVEAQEESMSRVAAAFPGAAIDHLDGLTVDLGERWFNLRPSNTEPLLRLNAEAPDQGAVASLVEEVTAIVESGT